MKTRSWQNDSNFGKSVVAIYVHIDSTRVKAADLWTGKNDTLLAVQTQYREPQNSKPTCRRRVSRASFEDMITNDRSRLLQTRTRFQSHAIRMIGCLPHLRMRLTIQHEHSVETCAEPQLHHLLADDVFAFFEVLSTDACQNSFGRMSFLTVTAVHLTRVARLHNYAVISAQACGSISSIFAIPICNMYHPVS